MNALEVSGLETSVIMGKYRGGTGAGIRVYQPDLYLANVYVENNVRGLHADGVGSITAHHVHAFNNSSQGFYLAGTDYSQFVGCYADTNGASGYEIRDTSNGMTLIDCWGYKSANVTASENDFAFYNARGVRLIGCRSSGNGAQSKLSSYKFQASSQVDLIGCHAVTDVNSRHTGISFTNCTGILQKYNRATDVVQSDGISVAASEPGQTISISFPQPALVNTPGIMAFQVNALIRSTDNTMAKVEQFLLVTSTGVSGVTQTAITASPILTLTSPSITTTTYNYQTLNFTLANTSTKALQISFNVRYLGTGRGFN